MTESVIVALDNFNQGCAKISRSLRNLQSEASDCVDFELKAVDKDGEPNFLYAARTDLGPMPFYLHCRRFFEFIDEHGSMNEIEFQSLAES